MSAQLEAFPGKGELILIRKSTLFLLVILHLTAILTSIQGSAVEITGEIGLSLSAGLGRDGNFTGGRAERLTLQLSLPEFDDNRIRYESRLLLDGDVNCFTRKLYLQHKFDDFQLTVGRQPVSWSFGSLLNPVDYSLGAVALEEESEGKYTDAVEVYVPYTWNSGLTFVASFPAGFTEPGKTKWGVRARAGVKGYDLTLNYVREAETSAGEDNGIVDFSIASFIPERRIGVTAKGDLGEFGVYGALGYYFDHPAEGNRSYLLGADYSYRFNYQNRINLQLEYLGLEVGDLDPSAKSSLLHMSEGDGRLDLLTGSANYPLDNFSSVRAVAILDLDDRSLFLSPSYQNTLPNNIDWNIDLSVFMGGPESLFGPDEVIPKVTTSMSFTYLFTGDLGSLLKGIDRS